MPTRTVRAYARTRVHFERRISRDHLAFPIPLNRLSMMERTDREVDEVCANDVEGA